jgi:hypothetical protein
MGQPAIPTETQSIQAYNPNALDWANFALKQQMQGLQMQYYTPLLKDTMEKRKLYKGVVNNDPEALRQFAGMPKGATPQQVLDRINTYRGRGTPNPLMPNPQMPSAMGAPDAYTQARQNKLAQSRDMADLMGVRNPYAEDPGKIDTAVQKMAEIDRMVQQKRNLSQDMANLVGVQNPNLQKKAAGGIMQLKGYKSGKQTKKTAEPKAEKAKPGLNQDQATFVQQMGKLMESGKTPTQAQQDRLNKIEGLTGRDVSPYSTAGTIAPTNKGVANAATRMSTAFNKGQGTTEEAKEPTPNPYSRMEAEQEPMYGVIGGKNPSDAIQITDPWANKAFDYLNQMQAPSEWGQAGGMFSTAAQGLQGLAGYTPQQVAYSNAAAQQGAAERAAASQMGSIADVSADRVNLGQYNINAAQMQRPEDVAAREIEAKTILGAQMQRPEDVQAQALQRYQMDATAPISTQDLEAFQMAGPGSWTDEGVSSKYMSPYMQGVVDISKREAERDYTKQMNALAAKAKSAGAFGGARQALERSEAQRNFNQQLGDIQTKGMQQAYESGRSQYGQELSLSQQAGLQNLQSKLSTQSQSSQQALQAMLANQNIDYQTKLQNLQAMLGVQSQEAQQMLNASLANQQVGLTTNQQNLQAEMQKQLANQQAGMTSQQANQQAFLQAALANQQSGLTSSQINAQLAQQAALANQGVGVQGDLANQQAALQAALANQQTQFGVGSLNANLANQVGLQNAQLGTQASLQNAQLGTQTNLANAQNALQAGMANQQAGLQGNQQNIGAYNAMGNMGQGLGAIGNQNAAWQQSQFGNFANIANWTQQLNQSAYDRDAAFNQGVIGGSRMPGQPPATPS